MQAGIGAFRAGYPEQRILTGPNGSYVDNRGGYQDDRVQHYERRHDPQSEQGGFLHRRQVIGIDLCGDSTNFVVNLIFSALEFREPLRRH